MTFPPLIRSFLPPNTIAPQKEELFAQYITRLYEDISYAVNEKDFNFYAIPVTDTATNITNLPNFGAYIVCVSGIDSGLPCLTAALSKSGSGSAGVVTVLNSQAGVTAPWIAATLTITSTATNFQINHSVGAQTGNFNIRIIGTQ